MTDESKKPYNRLRQEFFKSALMLRLEKAEAQGELPLLKPELEKEYSRWKADKAKRKKAAK